MGNDTIFPTSFDTPISDLVVILKLMAPGDYEEDFYTFQIIELINLYFQNDKGDDVELHGTLGDIGLGNLYFVQCYVRNFLKGRWVEIEPYIVTNPKFATWYAEHVLGGRWEEAELYIKQHHETACEYAKKVIRGSWPEAESKILTCEYTAFDYEKHVIKGKWENLKE